jgi:type II secretory pathway predicted ATPase ExeA
MFETFYGLSEDPFRLSSDHRFCFPHRNYARARAYVDYALHRAEGFVMVTGNPGTGKTTLINELLCNLPQQTTRAATLLSTRLEAEDLLHMMAYSLGLRTGEQPKALLLQQLMEFMSENYRRGVRTLLIIDEAQDLNASALEELRLLTNLHEASRPLLQIVLVGQEPLRQLVRRPEMEQLHQRLIAAWHLKPLGPEETVGYVRHRLETAGWQGDPAFEPGVMETVFAFSRGVPRRINLICSRLLLHGCISELHRLTRADAMDIVAELGAEELAPVVDDGSAGTQAEIDWATIDQGLIWMLPEPEQPESSPTEPDPPFQSAPTTQEVPDGDPQARRGEEDDQTVEIKPEKTALGMPRGAGDGDTANSAPDALLKGSDAHEEAERASASGARVAQARPVTGSGARTNRGSVQGRSAAVAMRSEAARKDLSSAQRADPGLSTPPGLAVEDSGDSRLLYSSDQSARTSSPACPSASTTPLARQSRFARRRGPVVLGIIVFVLLALVPRDTFEWLTSYLLPLVHSSAVSIGVSEPPL